MGKAYKVLGQSNPSATTLTDLYTVPAATSAVVSTLTIANLAASSATVRVAIRVAGAAIANKHYVIYDVTLPASATRVVTVGLTLAATDVVSVYASSATVAFAAYGAEVS